MSNFDPVSYDEIQKLNKKIDFPIVNMFENGNFADKSFWSYNEAGGKVAENNVMKTWYFDNELLAEIYRDIPVTPGHKYFISEEMSSRSTRDALWISEGDFRLNHTSSGEYLRLGTIITATTNTVTIHLLNSDRTGSYNDTYACYIRNAIMIDLTETFGEGKEPTFDGVVDILQGSFPSTNGWTGNDKNSTFQYKKLFNYFYEKSASKGPWTGKTANFVGDSITANSRGYIRTARELMGLSAANNYGVGGGRLCLTGVSSVDDQYPALVTRFQELDADADVVFVLIGTNDFASQVPLGDSASTSEYEFNGGLNIVMNWLRDNFPDRLVVFSTLLHRKSEETNPNPITMNMYRNAIRERCEAKHFVCYDAYANTGFDFTADYYTNATTDDGLHPNDMGAKILGRKIASFLNAQ